jgi:hypothetical protein
MLARSIGSWNLLDGQLRNVQLTIVLHEDDLAEIAKRGYEGAASTDPKLQAEAVSLFVSDTLWG